MQTLIMAAVLATATLILGWTSATSTTERLRFVVTVPPLSLAMAAALVAMSRL